jgi:hypothetical protein
MHSDLAMVEELDFPKLVRARFGPNVSPKEERPA